MDAPVMSCKSCIVSSSSEMNPQPEKRTLSLSLFASLLICVGSFALTLGLGRTTLCFDFQRRVYDEKPASHWKDYGMIWAQMMAV